MNKRLFRIVFNAHRQLKMAIPEVGSVVSLAKAVDGASTVARLAAVTVTVFGSLSAAHAQIIANIQAPKTQQPTIFSAGNGTPVVNIQTPSAAGVSRNSFSQFDVQSKGVVLNNGQMDTQTKQAGWVQANPWLVNGSAKVILNEVSSNQPSHINGYIEVAGQRADVIVANPAGISVNGGGFINASKGILTTGNAVFNAAGGIDSYRVQGGQVTIDGAGLDMRTTDYGAILARAVQVNAGLWAHELKVVTGANQIDAASLDTNTTPKSTPIEGSGSTPSFALDVAQIGGMYAGKIYLVGTEAGLGVRNAGSLSANGAQGGDLVLTANGWLTNTASGAIQAQGDLRIAAQGDVTNRGAFDGTLTRVEAANVTNIGTGRIYGDHIAIKAGTMTNTVETVNGTSQSATVAARDRLDIAGTHVINQDHALMFSNGDMSIGAGLDSKDQATGAAQSFRNGSAMVDVNGHLTINADNITNANDHFAYKTAQELINAETDPNHWQNDVMSKRQLGVYEDNGDSSHYYRVFDRYVYEPLVTQSDPGQITAAGNITLTGRTVVNQQSKIIAGGNLWATAASIDNQEVTSQRIIKDVGNQWSWGVVGGHSSCYPCHWVLDWGLVQSAYNVTNTQTLTVSKGATLANTPLTGPVASALNPTQVATTVTNGLTLQGTGAGFALPSLYKPTTVPNASYYIETDPLFTHRNTWLGSEYMTRRVSLDPSATQKRLGDGFFEQQMIREQVASLTGKRFLDNFTSEQQEYQALMDAGITFAQQFHLRPGIALTDVQVAQLSSDIVWLESQTVTLPNGQVTQALVPHVYLKPGKGDLTDQGALLSGSNVTLKATGDITNSGEIAGRQLLELNANNVQNLAGQMAAQKVSITSQQDIVNQGGSVTAQNSLNLQAGRDVVVETATTSSVSGAHSATILDRVAGLYVTASQGTLVANAGRDMTITAAELQSAGSVALQAGRNVNLNAQTTGSSDRFSATGEATFHQFMSNTNQTGSQLEAAGNLSITAGNNLQGVAATVHGGGDVQLKAGNDVQLLAGQSTRSNDLAWVETDSTAISSKTTATQITDSAAKAIVSQVSGKTLDITAERNLVSQGTQLSGKDSLHVEGKDSQAFYAVQDVEQRSFHQETHQSLVGISIDKSSVSDSSFKSSSIASTLQSNEKIDINVGNVAYFEGTKVDAKQINLTQSDQSKAGQVILSASVDTTQKVHSETHETAGVWQAQSGNGETKQTANQTQFNGQLNINPNLQLTVQLGIKPGQTVNEQAHALAQLPGLSYLKDLENNPKVNWTGIELASKEWSYSQEGLTPAGAALLSVAIAAYTGNMGADLLGGSASTAATATTAGTQATLMGSTMLGAAANAGFASLSAQAGVALVNNGGDIGKALKALGSDANVKNMLAAMATAGVLSELGNVTESTGQSGNGSLSNSTSGISTSQAANQFTNNLTKNITNNLAGAVINSAITGKPLNEVALQAAISSAFITAGMAQAANTIGDAKQAGALNDYTQALAHAVAGCLGGAAASGNSGGCSPGALGAVVGELTMKFATDNQITGTNALKLATSMSALAGALVGGAESVVAVNVAAQMGTNAALNNFCKAKSNCEDRRFTFTDAVEHWRNGGGTSITDVDARELNLKDATFTKISDGVYRVDTSLKYDTGAVYGTVTAYINSDGTMSFGPDTYNFDIKGYSDTNTIASAIDRTNRNIFTGLGLLINGIGKKFTIEFKGSIPAPANLPR